MKSTLFMYSPETGLQPVDALRRTEAVTMSHMLNKFENKCKSKVQWFSVDQHNSNIFSVDSEKLDILRNAICQFTEICASCGVSSFVSVCTAEIGNTTKLLTYTVKSPDCYPWVFNKIEKIVTDDNINNQISVSSN